MRNVAEKVVPRLLTDDQKQPQVLCCKELKEKIQEDPNILKKVITSDETWVYCYDPETKNMSMQWKHPKPPGPRRQSKSRSKTNS